MVTGPANLQVIREPSGNFRCSVPGYGLVAWHRRRLTEHAQYLMDTHRPDQPLLARRLRALLPDLVTPTRRCSLCLSPWRCREAEWARWWLETMADGQPGAVR
jgi:hypothetical protein